MKKVLYLIIAVVIVLLYWLLNRPAVETPSDTTTAVQAELDGLNVGDLDKEFQSIDADLGQL